MSHPSDLIARVKALMLLGMSVKGAASIVGVPHGTVRAWRYGWRRADVCPDRSVKESIVVAIKGDIRDRQAQSEKLCSPAEGARQHGNPPAATEAKPSDSPEPGSH